MPDQKKKYYFLSYRHKSHRGDWKYAERYHRCLDVHPLTWLSEQYNDDGGDPSLYCDMYEIIFWTELTKEEYEEHKKIWGECEENVHPKKQVAVDKPRLDRAE